MCAAVKDHHASTSMSSSTTAKKSGTFLCCAPCCFGLAKANNSTTVEKPSSANKAQNGGKNPFLDSTPSSEDEAKIVENVAGKTAPNSASFPSRQFQAYSPGSPPSSSSCPPLSPLHQPAKLGFLVSFLVDARGGAMKGNRGSGLRLIIPQGKKIQRKYAILCSHRRRDDDV